MNIEEPPHLPIDLRSRRVPRPVLVGLTIAALILAVGAGLVFGALRESASMPASPSPSSEVSPTMPAASASQIAASAAQSASAEPTPSPSPMASPPPAEPVSATVEEHGIRLTLELDRNRTAHGERVWGLATVENIGADSVFWGHSGTCVYPASIGAAPDDARPIPYGRDDWPGEAGILKMVTVDPRHTEGFGFTPEDRVDLEGNFGCTSDLQITEIPPGAVLTQRAASDTLSVFGMPPRPGAYTVQALHAFMTRGAPPAFDENVPTDQFRVTVSVPYHVDGEEAAYLSPGEAVDRVLADDAFRTEFDTLSRERWTGSNIEWRDGAWVLELGLDRRPEYLQATVDPLTGEVSRVRFVPREDIPGG